MLLTIPLAFLIPDSARDRRLAKAKEAAAAEPLPPTTKSGTPPSARIPAGVLAEEEPIPSAASIGHSDV